MRLAVAAGCTVLAFLGVVLLLYRFQPTPATVFLVAGWMSILAAGYFLVRAVNSFRLAPGGTGEDLSDSRRSELEREKKLLVKAIKEIEFDRDTGKLDGGEAAAAIGRYRGRAIEILRLLDEDPSRRYEAEIEKELARRLAAADAESQSKEVAGPPVCVSCATVNDTDATFCKKCGARIAS